MVFTVVQVGLPGGQELLIIAMIFAMIAIPVVAIALALRFLIGRNSTDGEQTAQLRERVALLEHEVAELKKRQETANDA